MKFLALPFHENLNCKSVPASGVRLNNPATGPQAVWTLGGEMSLLDNEKELFLLWSSSNLFLFYFLNSRCMNLVMGLESWKWPLGNGFCRQHAGGGRGLYLVEPGSPQVEPCALPSLAACHEDAILLHLPLSLTSSPRSVPISLAHVLLPSAPVLPRSKQLWWSCLHLVTASGNAQCHRWVFFERVGYSPAPIFNGMCSSTWAA